MFAITLSKRWRVLDLPHKSLIYSKLPSTNPYVWWPFEPWTINAPNFPQEGFKITIEDNLCKRKRQVVRIQDPAWQYLGQMDPRVSSLTYKCYDKVKPPKLGDVVIIRVDEDYPRNPTCPLGKFNKTYPGRNENIRIVVILS